jgi:hypothetical protein
MWTDQQFFTTVGAAPRSKANTMVRPVAANRIDMPTA